MSELVQKYQNYISDDDLFKEFISEVITANNSNVEIVDTYLFTAIFIINQEYLITVKHSNYKLDIMQVRPTRDEMIKRKIRSAVLITNDYFTPFAKSYAEEQSISLIDNDQLLTVLKELENGNTLTNILFTGSAEEEITEAETSIDIIDNQDDIEPEVIEVQPTKIASKTQAEVSKEVPLEKEKIIESRQEKLPAEPELDDESSQEQRYNEAISNLTKPSKPVPPKVEPEYKRLRQPRPVVASDDDDSGIFLLQIKIAIYILAILFIVASFS